jgi:hypothetical protein
MSDESEEEEERNPLADLWPEFEPIAQMPTSRLQVSARDSAKHAANACMRVLHST